MQWYPYDTRPSRLAKWMRSYGVRLSLLAYFALFWTVYSRLFIESTGATFASWVPEADEALTDLIWRWINNVARELGLRQFSPENIAKFGFLPTLWLFSLRLQPLIMCHVYFGLAISFLLSEKPPSPEPEGALEGAMKKTRSDHRPKAHCICIRVVTRGQPAAQSLIPRTVASAVTLLSNMCNCEHLKAHIVTQTKFVNAAMKRQWLDLGATEVREFFVPADYETPKGSLFRARNFSYWEATGGVGGDCREDESWILTLDEEVLITEQLVRSFLDDVLDNPHIQYALPPCLMDLRSDPIPLINRCIESASTAGFYFLVRTIKRGKDRPPPILIFHGSCYFARADVDRERGNDWGPLASVVDDYTIGLTIIDRNAGIKYLHGWYFEGSTLTVAGLITQRARFFRGEFYSTCAAPVSDATRVPQFLRIWHTTQNALVRVMLILFLLYTPYNVTPAGPPVIFLDLCVALFFAVDSTMYVFGAWNMMPDSDAVLCSLLAPFMVLFAGPVIACLIISTAFKQIYADRRRGAIAFYITAKTAKDQALGGECTNLNSALKRRLA